jgi:3'(2'), 5'-bisphosphate nucleotidase
MKEPDLNLEPVGTFYPDSDGECKFKITQRSGETMVDDNFVKKVIDIVKQAGEIIVEIYHEHDHSDISLGISYKDDNSPLTRADNAANEHICNSLRKHFDIPIISEESIVDYEIRKNWKRFWLVDPLDGTKDFIARNDDFTIIVTLIEDNIPVFGMIYAPARKELFYGIKDRGSYFIHKYGTMFRLPMVQHGHYIVGKSRFHNSDKVEQFIQENEIKKSAEIGSALKFCYLSKGNINVYPRFSGSMEWDIAAGHVILKEANCSIMDIKTQKEPEYNKPDFHNGHFIAYSNKIDISQLKF